ncbi:hypothetical protein BC828DRAFT_189759 [Blastocladiella britannica]|nr:hypothetical protein BC828DRAFT_189759 [Blastocladiella britannica]
MSDMDLSALDANASTPNTNGAYLDDGPEYDDDEDYLSGFMDPAGPGVSYFSSSASNQGGVTTAPSVISTGPLPNGMQLGLHSPALASMHSPAFAASMASSPALMAAPSPVFSPTLAPSPLSGAAVVGAPHHATASTLVRKISTKGRTPRLRPISTAAMAAAAAAAAAQHPNALHHPGSPALAATSTISPLSGPHSGSPFMTAARGMDMLGLQSPSFSATSMGMSSTSPLTHSPLALLPVGSSYQQQPQQPQRTTMAQYFGEEDANFGVAKRRKLAASPYGAMQPVPEGAGMVMASPAFTPSLLASQPPQLPALAMSDTTQAWALSSATSASAPAWSEMPPPTSGGSGQRPMANGAVSLPVIGTADPSSQALASSWMPFTMPAVDTPQDMATDPPHVVGSGLLSAQDVMAMMSPMIMVSTPASVPAVPDLYMHQPHAHYNANNTQQQPRQYDASASMAMTPLTAPAAGVAVPSEAHDDIELLAHARARRDDRLVLPPTRSSSAMFPDISLLDYLNATTDGQVAASGAVGTLAWDASAMSSLGLGGLPPTSAGVTAPSQPTQLQQQHQQQQHHQQEQQQSAHVFTAASVFGDPLPPISHQQQQHHQHPMPPAVAPVTTAAMPSAAPRPPSSTSPASGGMSPMWTADSVAETFISSTPALPPMDAAPLVALGSVVPVPSLAPASGAISSSSSYRRGSGYAAGPGPRPTVDGGRDGPDAGVSSCVGWPLLA